MSMNKDGIPEIYAKEILGHPELVNGCELLALPD
jgi:hypothetical protein